MSDQSAYFYGEYIKAREKLLNSGDRCSNTEKSNLKKILGEQIIVTAKSKLDAYYNIKVKELPSYKQSQFRADVGEEFDMINKLISLPLKEFNEYSFNSKLHKYENPKEKENV